MANPEWDNYRNADALDAAEMAVASTRIACGSHSLLAKAAMEDETVHRAQVCGQSIEGLVCVLVEEKKLLFKRIAQLEAIAPRKITLPDGKVMIWRCPDQMVPEN